MKSTMTTEQHLRLKVIAALFDMNLFEELKGTQYSQYFGSVKFERAEFGDFRVTGMMLDSTDGKDINFDFTVTVDCDAGVDEMDYFAGDFMMGQMQEFLAKL